AVMSREPRQGIDFFPLLVDYEERMYAIGRIPRVWLRREGRPSEAATLAARMIDRPLRPLFADGFRNDVQIVATVMSVEPDNAPEIAALIGASAALTISDIPFLGPVGGVRVGRVDGQFVINPTWNRWTTATWIWWWRAPRTRSRWWRPAPTSCRRASCWTPSCSATRKSSASSRCRRRCARRWASRRWTCRWPSRTRKWPSGSGPRRWTSS